ncbi:hypothetical protein SDC9_147202 [bioreactor metagenome]|uniref:Uncharacterized protein n=1 Tax=bioreactor metagenome TaxID=1076179 RepID=A0A645EDE8_9ZZZZ
MDGRAGYRHGIELNRALTALPGTRADRLVHAGRCDVDCRSQWNVNGRRSRRLPDLRAIDHRCGLQWHFRALDGAHPDFARFRNAGRRTAALRAGPVHIDADPPGPRPGHAVRVSAGSSPAAALRRAAGLARRRGHCRSAGVDRHGWAAPGAGGTGMGDAQLLGRRVCRYRAAPVHRHHGVAERTGRHGHSCFWL